MPRPSYALVTGASRGLGKYFARVLAASGRNLILVARNPEPLARLADELTTSHPIEVKTLTINLALAHGGEKLARELSDRGWEVDLLVNNAGFGEQKEFVQLALERQLEMINLQNATVVELTHELLTNMMEKGSGGIINVSSIAGFQPIPYAAVYSATKSFLTTFSLALEAEVHRYGIKVVTVCPGRLRADPEEQRDFERKKVPGGEQTHEEVVRASLEMLRRGGGLVIPGRVNKIVSFAVKLAPRSKVARLVKKFSKR